MSRPQSHHAAFTLGAALGVLALLAGGSASCSTPSGDASSTVAPAPTASAPTPAATPTPAAIEVRISEEARARAGMEITAPMRRAMAGRLRLPGSVVPDAYGQVTVMTLATGRVTLVPAELGTPVSEGQNIATISSTDVADAQAAYLNHLAAVEADHQRVMRLERLVAIGADSRQSLDDAKAMHANHASEVERALARLTWLGFRTSEIDRLVTSGTVTSDYVVRAPAAGVVTKRDVNPGQIVSVDAPVMQISRLDRVWVLASVYEQDAGRIRVGMPAEVARRGESGKPIPSRIAYVDPQVDPATRTAQVRLELGNANGALRFGMLVDVEVALPAVAGVLTVPSDAVQSVGSAQVLYIQDPQRPDVFLETPVTVGTTGDGWSEIRSGLAATDRVVTRGAFFVRAERLRTIR
jgi:RND family efflux transporter MFP subunit